jgi:hypothetical protein
MRCAAASEGASAFPLHFSLKLLVVSEVVLQQIFQSTQGSECLFVSGGSLGSGSDFICDATAYHLISAAGGDSSCSSPADGLVVSLAVKHDLGLR